MACFEITGTSHFFYGMGLHEHNQAGLAFWSNSGANIPYSDSSSTGGEPPRLLIHKTSKNVGIGTLSPSQRLHVVGNITCVSIAQTSDRRVKDDIQDADGTVMQDIFDAVSSKTYTRNDGVAGKRLGFIAQDVQEKLPEDWTNLVFEQGEADDGEEAAGEDAEAKKAAEAARAVLPPTPPAHGPAVDGGTIPAVVGEVLWVSSHCSMARRS